MIKSIFNHALELGHFQSNLVLGNQRSLRFRKQSPCNTGCLYLGGEPRWKRFAGCIRVGEIVLTRLILCSSVVDDPGDC